MTDIPAPPMPAPKPDRSKYWKWGGIGFGALVLFAVVTDDGGREDRSEPAPVVQQSTTTVATTVPPAPTTTESAQDIEARLQIAAINEVVETNRVELCRLIRELTYDDNIPKSLVIDMALEAFVEGFGSDLLPEAESVFRSKIRECF